MGGSLHKITHIAFRTLTPLPLHGKPVLGTLRLAVTFVGSASMAQQYYWWFIVSTDHELRPELLRKGSTKQKGPHIEWGDGFRKR